MESLIKKIVVDDKKYMFDGNTLELFKVNSDKELNDYLSSKKVTVNQEKFEKELSKIVLNMSNACNLNCRYCYADGGNYGRKNELMTLETLQKIIVSLKTKNINKIDVVSFFGGEPLLNFDLIEYGLKHFSTEFSVNNFEMVTNGQLLTESMVDVLKKYNVSLSISCDGPENITDLLRGKGVFSKVKNAINLCKQKNYDNIMISATFTHQHEKMGYTREDISTFFREKGLRMTLTKVISKDSYLEVNNGITEEEARNDMRQSLTCIDKVDVVGKVNPYMYSLLLSLIYKARTIGFCDDLDISRTISFDYNGDKYNCFRLWNDNKYRVGENEKTNVYLKEANIKETQNNCKYCWCKYICKVCIVSILQKENSFPFKDEKCAYREMYIIALEELIKYIQKGSLQNLINNFVEYFVIYK